MALRARRRSPEPAPAAAVDHDTPQHWRDMFDPDEPLPPEGLPPGWCHCQPEPGQTAEQHDAQHAWEWRIAQARGRFQALTDPTTTNREDLDQ